jgi:hypothetical protein
MVGFVNLTSGEPNNLEEAIKTKNWENAKDE